MKLDFIEIGTSDFRTLAHSTGVGISIEPIKPYFDNLPERKGLTKINAAISNSTRVAKAYYCDPEFIKRLNLPAWLKGCNSIDTKHPSVAAWCKKQGIKESDLVKETEVECITLKRLFEAYNVEEVDFLKVDTEGHDYYIIKSLFELENMPIIKKIQFESNSLMRIDQHIELVAKAEMLGYKSRLVETKGNQDTILEK